MKRFIHLTDLHFSSRDKTQNEIHFEPRKTILNVIKEINNYKKLNPMAIILVEHEMHLIKKFTNRTIVLNYGKKIADGSYEVVSKNEAVIEAYLGKS